MTTLTNIIHCFTRLWLSVATLLFCTAVAQTNGPQTLAEVLLTRAFPVTNEALGALFPPEVFTWQTPIQNHYLFLLSIGGREPYAACDDVALSYFGVKDRPAMHLCTLDNQAIMATLTHYHSLLAIFPQQARVLGPFLDKNGINLQRSNDLNTTQGYASKFADRVINYFANDGWNRFGDANGISDFPIPYEDTTNYKPKNAAHLSPNNLKYPLKWQPLTQAVPNSLGDRINQIHVTPHIGRVVKPHSMSMKQWKRIKTKSPYNYPKAFKKIGKKDELTLKRNYIPYMLREMRSVSKDMNRLFRAYWWDNKIFSIGLFGAYTDFLLGIPLEGSYSSIVGESIALYDAILLAWREKTKHDLMRPGPLIKRLFSKKKVNSWRGLGKPSGFIPSSQWSSVVRTMPHSEFPSASAVMCHAVLGFIEKHLKYKFRSISNFTIPPFNVTYPEGALPSIPVSQPVNVYFNTLQEAADDCANSRLWAGLHFKPSVETGKRLGKIIAESTFQTYQDLQEGRVPAHCHWCVKED